jgi:hypothetical protein
MGCKPDVTSNTSLSERMNLKTKKERETFNTFHVPDPVLGNLHIILLNPHTIYKIIPTLWLLPLGKLSLRN